MLTRTDKWHLVDKSTDRETAEELGRLLTDRARRCLGLDPKKHRSLRGRDLDRK